MLKHSYFLTCFIYLAWSINYFQDNAVSVQSMNGYSARSDISDRQFDNREWVMVESDFKKASNGGVVSFELRLAVKKKN